ncbi:hypothetical protein ABIA35_009165 [Catenulispora sp. MAP12-49]
MPASFLSLFDELEASARNEDPRRFQQRFGEIWTAAQDLGPEELTAGVERIATFLGGCWGIFAKSAVLAGALVERGGSPVPLAGVLPKRAAVAMERQVQFPGVWAAATRGRPLPDPAGGLSGLVDAGMRIKKKAKRTGLSEDECFIVSVSWFDTEEWLKALITVLALRDFRAAMGEHDRIRVRDAAAAIAHDVQRAHWVLGLSVVLDDEPLIVLDPSSGRGFRLTMSGVGDNHQLHTLLADRLMGPGLLDGERPGDAWVAAASTAHPTPPGNDPIYRRFRLFDGTGAYVYPEGRPADIERLNGMRVLVLHPPRGNYGWLNGRTYEHMESQLDLDGELTPVEAGDWLARIAPARETDLMGMNP